MISCTPVDNRHQNPLQVINLPRNVLAVVAGVMFAGFFSVMNGG
jgi:hypothetical protein